MANRKVNNANLLNSLCSKRLVSRFGPPKKTNSLPSSDSSFTTSGIRTATTVVSMMKYLQWRTATACFQTTKPALSTKTD